MNHKKKQIWKEILVTYIATILLILLLLLASNYLPFIQSTLLGFVTLLFIFAAKHQIRKSPTPEKFGLESSHFTRDTLLGILISVVIFPLFFLGFWGWNTTFLGQRFDFSMGHYKQWPSETEGAPDREELRSSGVYVWTQKNEITILIKKDEPHFDSDVVIHTSTAVKPLTTGLQSDDISNDSTTWRFSLPKKNDPKNTQTTLETNLKTIQGEVSLHDVSELEIEVVSNRNESYQLPLFIGSNATLAHNHRLSLSKSYFWLIMWLLTHILLIALGEEIFYRGYLQERVKDALTPDPNSESPSPHPAPLTTRFLGVDVISWKAIFITSLFFAVGHLIIPIHGVFLITRLAVFFPSLLFGLVKERTHGIVAPTVLHGLSNMMVIISAVHFF